MDNVQKEYYEKLNEEYKKWMSEYNELAENKAGNEIINKKLDELTEKHEEINKEFSKLTDKKTVDSK
jgi:deoxyadenosine/deoxycytidine kinase